MKYERTLKAKHRLADMIKEGKFFGRSIISRDTPIDGGVYLGGNPREALVVDSIKYPLLAEYYDDLKRECKRPLIKTFNRPRVIPITMEKVTSLLTFSVEEVNRIVKEYDVADDYKISLTRFIKEGYGVCRHQALLAGFFMEKFAKEKLIRGKVSMDRNSSYSGAHCWVRYVNSRGEVGILDPAQDFWGTLEESIEQSKWWYSREEDLLERRLKRLESNKK